MRRAEARGKPFTLCQDSGVRAAERYWSLRRSCRDEAARRRLSESMANVDGAYQLWQERPGWRRAVLEARVLAGEPVGDIACKAGLPIAVVQIFEELFFAIRPQRRNVDYIVTQVLSAGPRRGQSSAEADLERLWKTFAYLAGPHALEAALGFQRAPQLPRSAAEAAAFLGKDAQGELARQLALAVRGRDLRDPRALGELLRACALLGQDKEGADGITPWEAHVKAHLEDLGWTMGVDGGKGQSQALNEIDESAVEARADELERLAAGKEVEELKEWKGFKMPPPRAKAAQSTSVKDL